MTIHLNYIGSKRTLFDRLNRVFRKYVTKDTLFADLFAGTGTVAHTVSKTYSCPVVSNDLQFYAFVVNRAILSRYTKKEAALIDRKIDELNALRPARGFVAANYAPPRRMYFTLRNAGRIDAMRAHLEREKAAGSLSHKVYFYLLAKILSAADKVANTSSVYAAYLKSFKPSALKPIALTAFEPTGIQTTNAVFQEDVLALLARRFAGPTVPDVVYLDPPYNARQYSDNYHVLDTIAKYDRPAIHGTTGIRDDVRESRSSFASKVHAEQAFVDLIDALRRVPVIILSYNDEGIVPQQRMRAILARHGRGVKLIKIPYKKFKAQEGVERPMLYEYLFVSERRHQAKS